MNNAVFTSLLAAIAISCGLFLSCATVPEDAGFADLRDIVDDRMSYRLHWNKGAQPDREVMSAIDRLLSEELTVDGAVQIALLNNADLSRLRRSGRYTGRRRRSRPAGEPDAFRPGPLSRRRGRFHQSGV